MKDLQIIVVTVQDKNAYFVPDIANVTVEIFIGEVAKIMNVDNITVLSKAEVAAHQSPIKLRSML